MPNHILTREPDKLDSLKGIARIIRKPKKTRARARQPRKPCQSRDWGFVLLGGKGAVNCDTLRVVQGFQIIMEKGIKNRFPWCWPGWCFFFFVLIPQAFQDFFRGFNAG